MRYNEKWQFQMTLKSSFRYCFLSSQLSTGWLNAVYTNSLHGGLLLLLSFFLLLLLLLLLLLFWWLLLVCNSSFTQTLFILFILLLKFCNSFSWSCWSPDCANIYFVDNNCESRKFMWCLLIFRLEHQNFQDEQNQVIWPEAAEKYNQTV